MRIGLKPLNPTVGDIDGNARLIEGAIAEAKAAGAQLLVLPELCVCGYPPMDLLWREGFVEACERAAEGIGRAHTDGIAVVMGLPIRLDASDGGHRPASAGRLCSNGLVVYRDGEEIGRYRKRLLPTYDVFDELRYFRAGDGPAAVEVGGERVGLVVCEDLWRGDDAGYGGRYDGMPDPVAESVGAGATVIAAPSASPFVLGKWQRHEAILKGHARAHGVVVCGVNQTGGNDELIFDGHAVAVGASGDVIARAPGFDDGLVVFESDAERAPTPTSEIAQDERLLRDALVLGVRDYVRKTGFSRVVIGLSGGIDSAVTAAIGVLALGPENVVGALMPSRYSSEHSKTDAWDLARRLRIRAVEMPIEGTRLAAAGSLDPAFGELGEPLIGGISPDITEENVQSRVRGLFMMALSNRTGALVLTTGNKSELAVGYCTLYGDMNGALAVLSDVPKTWVYRLARWMNREGRAHAGVLHGLPEGDRGPIPLSTVEKPPSAELAEGQVDQDSLPPYEELDRIIELYVDDGRSPGSIAVETGYDAAMVERMCRLIRVNEYKRRQAATGLKVTRVAFGTGRRVPIAHRWG